MLDINNVNTIEDKISHIEAILCRFKYDLEDVERRLKEIKELSYKSDPVEERR